MRRLTDGYVRVLLNVYIDRMYVATEYRYYTYAADDGNDAYDAYDPDIDPLL